MKTLLRWLLPTLALIAAGPLAAQPIAGLRLASGSTETSLLLNTDPLRGAVALAVALAVAAASGFLAARLVDARLGFNVVGLTLAWPAMRTGDLAGPLAAGGSPVALLVESLIVVAVVVSLTTLIERTTAANGSLRADVRKTFTGRPHLLLALGIGVAAGLFGAWLVAFDSRPGQALVAAILAAGCAAAAVHLMTSSLEEHAPERLDVIAVLVCAVVAPASLAILPGLGSVAETARQNALTGPGAIQPLMWAPAVFIGVPLGRGWARSSVEQGRRTAALSA